MSVPPGRVPAENMKRQAPCAGGGPGQSWCLSAKALTQAGGKPGQGRPGRAVGRRPGGNLNRQIEIAAGALRRRIIATSVNSCVVVGAYLTQRKFALGSCSMSFSRSSHLANARKASGINP